MSITEVNLSHTDCAIEGVAATFAAICGEDPTWEEVNLDRPKHQVISGAISLVGDIGWSVILSFAPGSATSMAFRFAGFEIPYESADMVDVVGELANVVAGDITQRLSYRGIKADLSLPMVARGADVEVLLPGATSARVVRFMSVDGDFWCEVATA